MASNPNVAAAKEQTEGQSTPAGTKASSVTIDVNVATIDIEDLYNKDKFDMSTMETDNIFQLLKTGENGLTTAEAESRIAKVKIMVHSPVSGFRRSNVKAQIVRR